jgi:hypothetical protein
MASIRLTAFLTLLMLAGGGSAAGETIVTLREGVDGYTGASDASMYEDFADNANGGHPYIYAGVTQVDSRRRGLIRFDLETLPADAAIESAELELTLDLARGFVENYRLHRLTADWGEGEVDTGDPGGQGLDANEGDATWNSNFHDISTWAAPGGDFITTPSVSIDIGTEGAVVFSDPGMAEDVRGWVAQPETNFGWVLIGEESGAFNARRFFSSEAPGSATRPMLRLTLAENAADAAWALYP